MAQPTKLALIGTFYQRRNKTLELLNRVLKESTRSPDEFWMMCEDEEDAAVADGWEKSYNNLHIKVLNTPCNEDGSYKVIPYSNKINWALDHTDADFITYLDNGSMPHPRKYEVMVGALDRPGIGAVYCSQTRTGTTYGGMIMMPEYPISDAYSVLNYTQVMHRKTDDRWDLDMQWAVPYDLADAKFWRKLHASLGDFYPAWLGEEILDEHRIDGLQAVGL